LAHFKAMNRNTQCRVESAEQLQIYFTQTSHIKNGIRTLKNQYFSL